MRLRKRAESVGSGTQDMRGQGTRIFVDELARFAADAADARLMTIAETAAAPLRVAVRGRAGVGCSTVARALDRAGVAARIRVTESVADVVVYVTAEVMKPEDAAAIAAAQLPVVALLNKADLTGFAGDGPIVAARARCARFAELVGVPVEPIIGLLAVAAVDVLENPVWDTLRGLAGHHDSALFDGSFEGFLAADVSVPTEDRVRLLETLDLFGAALGVAAVRNGVTPAQLRALLRRVSCVDAVIGKIHAVGAEVRYRRVLDAVAALEALAVADDALGARISEFLAHDDTVLARMAAATDLAEAELGPVGDGADSAAHLSRAVRWQRYSQGPVSEVHRAFAVDIARGSLRLWLQSPTHGDLP